MSILPEKKTIIEALKKAYVRFLKLRGRPREIALGFALGAFFAIMPFFGFQIALSVFFAALLGWNKFSAAMATWISNPLTYPFIYSFTYFIGSKFVGTQKPLGLPDDAGLTFISKMLHKAPEMLVSLTIGGVITAIPVAVISYYFSYEVIHRYQERLKKKKAEQQQEKRIKRRQKRRKKKASYPWMKLRK